MSKLEQLEAAIRALPDEYRDVSRRMLNMLSDCDLANLRAYSLGLRDMALHLTSDEKLLGPLTDIRKALK